MALLRLVRECGYRVLDLLYPPHCLECGRSGVWLCPDCVSAAARSGGPKWLRPGAGPPLAVWSVGMHDGVLRRAVHALKYEGMHALARPMAGLMATVWRAQAIGAERLAPVPLHPRRARERGYNQSALLARALAQEVGVTADAEGLSRTRYTPAQVGLRAAERMANVRGAFRASERLAGRTVVLLDDVCTSGATLLECAAAVRAAGGTAVAAVTFTAASSTTADDHSWRRP